jgi:ribose 5-phosphate isomerase B
VQHVRVAFGTDEDTPMTAALAAHLEAAGHTVMFSTSGAAWPEVGREVAEAVSTGAADRGVVCCWTGTGVSIAANKVAGARAALCTDAETARGARRWNDANVVAIGLRLTSGTVACEIVDAFLDEATDPSEAPAIARLERDAAR